MRPETVRPSSHRTSRAEVAALLAPVVGDERATSAVQAAALGLGLGEGEFSADEVSAILTALSRSSDLLGLAARRALAKRDALEERHVPESGPSQSGARSTRWEEGEVPKEQLVELLTAALGVEKAQQVVSVEFQRAHLGDTATREQAIRVLDALATLPGLVGVTARFAKARFLLR